MAVKQPQRRGKKKKEDEVEQVLNEQEKKELADGQALHEMERSNPGWQIIKQWLIDAAYHSWVDPRQTKNEKEWIWRELNAFHASNNAKEILENIARAISRAEYLDKVKHGEIQRKPMAVK